MSEPVSLPVKRQFSFKMIEAANKTIQSYKRLIADPEREIGKWDEFGNYESCRLCIALDLDLVRLGDHVNYSTVTVCQKCPLADSDTVWNFMISGAPCTKHTTFDSFDTSLSVYLSNMDPESKVELIESAKARLDYLLGRFREQGITLEETDGEESS
jgi:hypothetical protein